MLLDTLIITLRSTFYCLLLNPITPTVFSGRTYEWYYLYRPSGGTVGAVALSTFYYLITDVVSRRSLQYFYHRSLFYARVLRSAELSETSECPSLLFSWSFWISSSMIPTQTSSLCLLVSSPVTLNCEDGSLTLSACTRLCQCGLSSSVRQPPFFCSYSSLLRRTSASE